MLEKLASPICWNPELPEHRSKEKEVTLVDPFLSGESLENPQLVEPSPSPLRVYPLSPHLSLWYGKETNSLKFPHRRCERTGLSEEWVLAKPRIRERRKAED